MKYAVTRPDGVVEIRQDSSKDLPDGAIALTDVEYDELVSGDKTVVFGSIVASNKVTP